MKPSDMDDPAPTPPRISPSTSPDDRTHPPTMPPPPQQPSQILLHLNPPRQPASSPNIRLEVASDPKNLASLKHLNSLLLPVNYRENFYKDILTNPTDAALSRVAFWDSGISIVGGIRARWDAPETPPEDAAKRGGTIYLMTICVLSPFRRLGVALALLEDLLQTAEAWGVDEVFAHVWQENEDALEWYRKRGFTVDEGIVEGYYRKLRPDGARVVRLRICTTTTTTVA
ncbi:acyl-CoA N-acyltransferase [Tricharina praecox]|uniref:acyl-CoA N-acyltransferase n=1 Tax=Tricharina praecox TaxID=43433 RepID=UPI00221F939B|nr:acyl-CoA N-acyltransferase [Tricharina praecox]KAI5855337.1 acyl-CoA N-acyltransferase [Tricharina praecox]